MSTPEQLGTCDFSDASGTGPHLLGFACINWKPLAASTAAPTKQEGGQDGPDLRSESQAVRDNHSRDTNCDTSNGICDPSTSSSEEVTGAALEPGSADIALFGCCSYEETWTPGIKGWGATDEESRASGYVSVPDYDALQAYASKLRTEVERLTGERDRLQVIIGEILSHLERSTISSSRGRISAHIEAAIQLAREALKPPADAGAGD